MIKLVSALKKPISEILLYERYYFVSHARILTPLRYLLWHKKLREKAAAAAAYFDIPYSESLIRRMIWCYCAHCISMEEYFRFNCQNRTYREIECFIGGREILYWIWKMNDTKQTAILRDKYKCCCLFREYYGRRVVKGVGDEDLPEFVSLMLSQERVFVKPINGASGKGAHIFQADSAKKARALFHYLRRVYPQGFVAEELIRQLPEMAAFHPQSVNTVRINTIRHDDDDVRIWHPFFRVGQGESIVDNANSGGIQCKIDPDTGILSNGVDMHKKIYAVHPDTKKSIGGYQLPRWQEAVALVKNAAQILPDVRYIGWDLALTEKGWIMVEGNGKAFIDQELTDVGAKPEFRKELREIRRNIS